MYRYELHLHTKIASACGHAAPADYIPYYRERGFQGICVTDHFYYGNTAIDRTLPWNEFVTQFCYGYYETKAAATPDFDVFFGWEHHFPFGQDEYLILGLTPEWLLAHEEIHTMQRHEFFPYVRRAGGFVIQAHPYRERDYIRNIILAGDQVDAIEAYNAGNEESTCRRALELARNLNLPMVGGSDIHDTQNKDFELSGISLPYRAKTVEDLIGAIRRRECEIIVPKKGEGWQDLPLTPPNLAVIALQGTELIETDNYFYKQ